MATSENPCLTTKSGSDGKIAADLCPTAPSDRACPAPSCQQELLQEYTELKDRFQRCTNALASAAHDLKTPLSIVSGYIELLQSEKLGTLNERQREVLHDMRSSSHRLQHFIEDFLTYSVLETGELRMQYEIGDINACISEVCNLWSNRFQERGLALYFLPNDKVPSFPFDSAKIQRVLSNLLENASKFTSSGGTVWLHAEPHMWERRSAQKPGISGERRHQSVENPNAVKVSVSDTGPGIAPEFHLEVFDDFVRLPQTEKLSDGMGLGLAIARRLVFASGGKIWVESEVGAGCKFSFLVPLKPMLPGSAKGKRNE
jgi:signal transduction histidine kinase